MVEKAHLFEGKSGLKIGSVETDAIGALGALYDLGCKVVIVYCPNFGKPPSRKFTIAGNGVRIDHLLPILNRLEPGWGGPSSGTIIGSPKEGTKLKPEQVLRIAKENVR